MVTYNGHMEAGRGSETAKKRGLLSGQRPVVILFLFALASSVVFPYGVGIAVLAWIIALAGALVGVGFASYVLAKELFGRTATFGYAPTSAYLAGKKMNRK